MALVKHKSTYEYIRKRAVKKAFLKRLKVQKVVPVVKENA